MGSQQTTTVQHVMDFCKIHTKLQNFFGIGGIANEPGMMVCNHTIQMLLSMSNAWRHNRKPIGFNSDQHFLVTQQGKQDYRWGGACAFVPVSGLQQPAGGSNIDLVASPVSGTAGVTVSGGVVTVSCIDDHPFTSANVGQTIYLAGLVKASGADATEYNSVLSYDAFAQTSQWVNGYAITGVPNKRQFTFAAVAGQNYTAGAPGVTDFGWLESASLTDLNSRSYPLPILPIKALKHLAPVYSRTGDQPAVSVETDFQDGTLQIRLNEPYGVYPFAINLVYQKRPPLMTVPTDIIPWPDNHRFVLLEVALWMAFRFATGISSAETQSQFLASNAAIMQARTAEDQADSDEGLVPQYGLMGR